MKNRIESIGLACVLTVSSCGGVARDTGPVSGDRGTDRVVDAVVVRPLGLAATVIGSVLTVVALPFTLPSGSVDASARELIVKPAEYTFKRPLGDFSRNGD